MRFYSTPQSSFNQEITKLAIFESIASVTLYVGIGIYFGTLKYLAITVVLAPLTLFRTERSVECGLEMYKRTLDSINRQDEPYATLGSFLLAPIIGTAIRIVSTVYSALRTPLQTLKDTPQSWFRQTLCTDFAYPPEIVPQEAVREDLIVFKFADFLEVLRDKEDRALTLIAIACLLPYFIVGWMFSVIYRVSFKATAIAYMPFIWVAHATLQNPLSLKARLERITKGEIEKVRRGFSWVILTTLIAKIAVVSGWIDKGYIESQIPSHEFVTSFVILDSWPWWQITLAVDAVVTFFLLFYADAALARLDDQRAWRENVVVNIVSTISFVRAALSVVTISAFFYIALGIAAPDFVARVFK